MSFEGGKAARKDFTIAITIEEKTGKVSLNVQQFLFAML